MSIEALHKCRTALMFTYCHNKFGIDDPSSIIVLPRRVLVAKAENPGRMISFSKLRVPIGLDWRSQLDQFCSLCVCVCYTDDQPEQQSDRAELN